MWLIDTTSYDLYYYLKPNKDNVSYAVLSHRWEDEEVLFRFLYELDMIHVKTQESEQVQARKRQELQKFPYLAEIQSYRKSQVEALRGWNKLVRFCEYVRAKGYSNAWIDTCCIDKSSSEELQESINSMFQWYESAAICVTYLNDVDKKASLPLDKQFRASEWFQRGWTLQELLGPDRIDFVDRNWNFIGTKQTLQEDIIAATGIPEHVLTRERQPAQTGKDFSDASIAQKMSWISSRRTTREEDMAYCLLGLFGVNMPLLYGEGITRAFRRLQMQLIKHTADESIFAWKQLKGSSQCEEFLAPGPEYFSQCGAIARHCPESLDWEQNALFKRKSGEMTSHGFRMQMILWKQNGRSVGSYLAPLLCSQSSEGRTVCLQLKKINKDANGISELKRVGDLRVVSFDWKNATKNNTVQNIYLFVR